MNSKSTGRLGNKEQINFGLFTIFLILTVLYYFLRFQFHLVAIIPVLHIILFAILAISGGWTFLSSSFRFQNPIDIFMLLLIVHFLIFSPFVFYRDGLAGASYALKNYLFPMLLFFYVRKRFGYIGMRKTISILEKILLFVAIMYIAEFVRVHVLREGYFLYTDQLKEYVVERGSGGGLSQSWVEGDLYDLIRMPGVLSHNNATGLAIAIGLVVSVCRIGIHSGLSSFIAVSIFVIAILLTGARTAIISAVSGVIIVRYLQKGQILKSLLGIRFIVVAVAVNCMLFMLIVAGVIDGSAFSFVFSSEQAAKTLGKVFQTDNFYFSQFYEQLCTIPLILLSGVGISTPVSAGNIDWYFPIVTEDLFLLQIVSTYGVLLPILLLWGVIKAVQNIQRKNQPQRIETMEIAIPAIGIITTILVSTVHTNAMVKAQILPLFFMSLSMLSKYTYSNITRARLHYVY